jgi:hypothetical protein
MGRSSIEPQVGLVTDDGCVTIGRTAQLKLPAVKLKAMNMHDSHMMVILLVAASAFTLALIFTVFPQILQKLRALTGAKQTKTSQVPTKGSARTWTQADFDEDDEPSTMRKLSSMLDEAKGRRANLLSRLKAISNEG